MHAKRTMTSAIDLIVTTEPIDIVIASGTARVRFNGASTDVRSDRYNWVDQGDPEAMRQVRDCDRGHQAVEGQ